MNPIRDRSLFLNLGHAYDHLLMLLFPTAVLALEDEFQRPFDELIALAIPGFIAFAAGALPAGWLGDRWSRRGMIAVYFLGAGCATILTGLARTPFEIAAGLTLIGLFASIYHPVGIAILVEGREKVGKVLGINGVFGNFGLAGAALTAGVLADLISWRAAFIVPGAVVLATGLVYLALGRAALPRPVEAAPRATIHVAGRHGWLRIVAVLVVAILFVGVIFNASSVALPKLFEEGLTMMRASTLGVGGLVSLVIAIAAFAQVGVGYLIDKFPIKPIWIGIMLLQAPFLVLAGMTQDVVMVAVSLVMMILILGEVPIQDALVARYARDSWRSRAYAVKFLLALSTAPLAIPIIALLHGAAGDFSLLFIIMGGLALAVAVVALWLPAPRGEPAPVPGGGP